MKERDLDGANIVFVGGASGTGLAAAAEVARRGASVLIVSRDPSRGAYARDIVSRAGARDAGWLGADVSTVAGVAEAAEAIAAWRPAIHGLVHSAMDTSFRRAWTADGFDLAFGLQYLARYALNRALVERLAASGDGRIVHVGAKAPASLLPDLEDLQFERRQWTLLRSLMSSQVLGYLHVQEAARRWSDLPVAVTVACIGPTRTGRQPWWVRPLYRVIATTPDRSARNVVRQLVTADADAANGAVLFDPKRFAPTPLDYDLELAREVWKLSERLVAERGVALA